MGWKGLGREEKRRERRDETGGKDKGGASVFQPRNDFLPTPLA